MPDVLTMSAPELGDPMGFVVLVIADDGLLHCSGPPRGELGDSIAALPRRIPYQGRGRFLLRRRGAPKEA
jgi:hypothetical protein